MRWDPYILVDNNAFSVFWQDHLARGERDVLFILGRGFDVRALDAPTHIIASGGKGARHVWLIRFDNQEDEAEARQAMTLKNETAYKHLFDEDNIRTVNVQMGNATRPTATSKNTFKSLSDKSTLAKYNDIVLDISAMPRMVGLTAIAGLLSLLDSLEKSTGKVVNFHVTTAESVNADKRAASGSLNDEVTSVKGFSGHTTAEGDDYKPRVWFPVLGEDQDARLVRIRNYLTPNEICPIIPFPSREPRRGDELVSEYQSVLFDDFNIEPGNILLATEFNPFEAYKQIFGAVARYSDALSELGGCKAYVSPLSSKLLSVGALLACYDHRARSFGDRRLQVGIPYVESVSYGEVYQKEDEPRELYSMWLRGEWER